MKKKIISILLCVTLIFASLTIAFAEAQVIEKPQIKIVIDCIQGTYSSVPIVVNGRTLLPLREILVNLGVQNDNDHILWNGSESSVTVKKDSINIYLKVGNTNATVNNAAATIDAAPVNYKGKVYIPARFIAQSFGKKVAWDAKSNMVLIRDESEFNKIKEIISKVDTAMNAIERYKTNDTYNTNIYNNVMSTKTVRISSTSADIKNKVAYAIQDVTNFLNDKTEKTLKVELGMADKTVYVKNSDIDTIKTAIPEKDFNDSFIYKDLTAEDVLCAGLKAVESNNDITLTGNINIGYYLNSGVLFEGLDEYDLDSNLETSVVIDKNTNLVKQMNAKASGNTVINDLNLKFGFDSKSIYSD